MDVNRANREALNLIASEQRGLFSAAQAHEVGISSYQLSRGDRSGQLRRVRRGVYALNGVQPSYWEQVMAAALAAGPGAIVSHQSAAAVHRFECVVPAQVELTLPRHMHSRPPGALVHRNSDLGPADLVRRRGILVTSPCRTLVDMAGRLGAELTAKTVDEGLIARRWTVSELRECLRRARANVAGRGCLDEILVAREGDPLADSILEAKIYRMLQSVRPFEAHYAVAVGGEVYVLDLAWPSFSACAEIVGRAHRLASLSAFDRERQKLNGLMAAGWKVAHLTASMSAAQVLAAVRSMLTRQPGTPTLALAPAPASAGLGERPDRIGN